MPKTVELNHNLKYTFYKSYSDASDAMLENVIGQPVNILTLMQPKFMNELRDKNSRLYKNAMSKFQEAVVKVGYLFDMFESGANEYYQNTAGDYTDEAAKRKGYAENEDVLQSIKKIRAEINKFNNVDSGEKLYETLYIGSLISVAGRQPDILDTIGEILGTKAGTKGSAARVIPSICTMLHKLCDFLVLDYMAIQFTLATKYVPGEPMVSTKEKRIPVSVAGMRLNAYAFAENNHLFDSVVDFFEVLKTLPEYKNQVGMLKALLTKLVERNYELAIAMFGEEPTISSMEQKLEEYENWLEERKDIYKELIHKDISLDDMALIWDRTMTPDSVGKLISLIERRKKVVEMLC